MKGLIVNQNGKNRTRTRSFNLRQEGQNGSGYHGNGSGTQRLNLGPKDKYSKYYAGAKFESIPQLTDLPVPPSHWTTDGRSQSTPSSPITISQFPVPVPRNCSTSAPRLFKSASLPGDSKNIRHSHGPTSAPPLVPAPTFTKSLQTKKQCGEPVNKRPVQKIQIVSVGKDKDKEISGSDLMELLLRASPNPVNSFSSCQFSQTHEYKEITDNLKTLLKVSAA